MTRNMIQDDMKKTKKERTTNTFSENTRSTNKNIQVILKQARRTKVNTNCQATTDITNHPCETQKDVEKKGTLKGQVAENN